MYYVTKPRIMLPLVFCFCVVYMCVCLCVCVCVCVWQCGWSSTRSETKSRNRSLGKLALVDVVFFSLQVVRQVFRTIVRVCVCVCAMGALYIYICIHTDTHTHVPPPPPTGLIKINIHIIHVRICFTVLHRVCTNVYTIYADTKTARCHSHL